MLSEVYDIECLSNVFTYTGYCRQTKEYHQFVIHSSRNDYVLLIQHLFRDKNLIMIGYNNDGYDYPIIHHMINHFEEYKNLHGNELSQKIYSKSQQIIESQFSVVADWNKHIQQIDLFKIWHYDNVAKATSLKNLEVAMNLPFVEDMPFEHNDWIEASQIPAILDYNKKDVIATNAFLDITLGDTELETYKGKNKLQLRYLIKNKYKINCINYNDIKLGTELILKLYCDKFRFNMTEVRKARSPRPIIRLVDCIPEWCNLTTKPFQALVNKFKTTSIYDGILKKVFAHSVIYRGIKIDFGAGGAHASINPGIYSSDEQYMILDVDVDAMYPMLGISQRAYPEHLGDEFIDIYDGEIVSKRLAEKKKPKAERDFVIVEGFKLAANGSYGKTNSEDSFLYDPLYTLTTTVSGQIFISMWIEQVCEQLNDISIIQVNTDGWTMRIPRKDHDKVLKISDDLCKLTGLSYEANYYDKMIIRDVNNYSAKYTDGKFKHKGDFEIERELHKDPSMKIVRIALKNYFFNGIPVEKTIKEHTNIYDFCLRLRTNKDCKAQYKYIEDQQIKLKQLSKTTRYYISNHGGSLLKYFNDGKISGVNIGFITTIFNTYEEKNMEDYDINYNFYILEAKKIIRTIEDKQLSLF